MIQLEDIIGTHTIDKLELPASFKRIDNIINKMLASNHYDVALAIGQAGGRNAITPGHVAISIDDVCIPDNDDSQPIDQTTYLDGAPVCFSNLSAKTTTQSIINQGLPGALPNNAGAFACSHTSYHLGYLQDKHYPRLRFGLTHTPYIPEQVIGRPDTPSVPLERIVADLTATVGAISNDEDLHLTLNTTEQLQVHR